MIECSSVTGAISGLCPDCRLGPVSIPPLLRLKGFVMDSDVDTDGIKSTWYFSWTSSFMLNLTYDLSSKKLGMPSWYFRAVGPTSWMPMHCKCSHAWSSSSMQSKGVFWCLHSYHEEFPFPYWQARCSRGCLTNRIVIRSEGSLYILAFWIIIYGYICL